MKDKKIKKPNIIFIIMDALRTKNLGCYGYYRETSPNIDSLAKQGVLFKNAFSSNNTTEKSCLSILSGRHILTEDKSMGFFTEKELNSFFDSGGIFLQEILKKNGYKTYSLTKMFGWESSGFDYFEQMPKKRGFITRIPVIFNLFKYLFYNFAPAEIRKKVAQKPNSEKITNKAIEIIKKTKGNFFIRIDYEDTDLPYKSLGKFANRFRAEKKSERFFDLIGNSNYGRKFIKFYETGIHKNDKIEDVIAEYDNAIAYDDYLIGKIIKTLKEEKLFEKTLIFFLSDHGGSLDEHRIYFAHHHGLYDIQMRVPLIITGDGIPKNKKINSFIQLTDIVPTVLDLLDINYDLFSFDGGSLLPLMNGEKKEIGESIFMEENTNLKKRGIRTMQYKYLEAASEKEAFCKICNNVHQGVVELYDLRKDPDEKINIAEKNKKVLMEMKMKLDEKIKEMKNINEKRRLNEALARIG